MNEGLTPGRSIAIIRDMERLLAEEAVRTALVERLAAARAALAEGTEDWAMQRVPLALFGAGLPPELRAARVSVFRGGSAARIERHENADQFSCLLRGALTIHVWEQGTVLRPRSDGTRILRPRSDGTRILRPRSDGTRWQARQFRADGHAQQRISYVARGLWHHPICPDEGMCELVGFHTATPAELIDEYAATREEAEGARAGTSRPQERE